MTNSKMYRQCLLNVLIISFVGSVLSAPTSTTTAPDTKSKSEGVQFKTSFPFGGSQYYGGSPYGYPQDVYSGSNQPYYGQSGPVSYPSYVLPQQSYPSYPYNTYGSYPLYQSTPYSMYPQYGSGSYQYPMSSGYPTNMYPGGSGSVSYLPENTGSTDLMKLLGSSNMVPSGGSISDINAAFPFDNNQQQISNIYQPQFGFGSNGASPGGYPSNSYDPYANIPVEIIDVDYTGGFKAPGASIFPQNTKPVVKVTSHSDSNGASVQPIVRTHSSVVTMKPKHTVITRTFDSTKDGPTVNVQSLSDDTDVNDRGTEAQEETNDIPNTETAKSEDEEPSDVSSWFK